MHENMWAWYLKSDLMDCHQAQWPRVVGTRAEAYRATLCAEKRRVLGHNGVQGQHPAGGENSHFTSKQVKMEYSIRWGFMLAQRPFLCGKKIFSFCVIWPLKTFVKLWLLSSANQVKIVKICSKQTFLCILACDIYNISLLSHCFTKIGYGQRTCDISISLMPHCLLLSSRGMCIQ